MCDVRHVLLLKQENIYYIVVDYVVRVSSLHTVELCNTYLIKDTICHVTVL